MLPGLFEVLPSAKQLRLARLTFASLRDVPFGEFGAFAEEKLFHLLFHDFLRIGVEGIQAVLIHDHFRVLEPHFPGVFGDIFVDALADFALPGNAVEAGEVASELDAVYDAFIVTRGLLRSWRWNVVRAFIVGHESLLSLVAKSYSFKDTAFTCGIPANAETEPLSERRHPAGLGAKLRSGHDVERKIDSILHAFEASGE